jgi:predicted RNA-binding Zn ribbon-like protein
MTDSRNDELRIVGGHLALDLVNTVAPRIPDSTDGHDYVAAPAELLAWSRRVAIIDEAEAGAITAAWQASPAVAGQALRATVEIREATYAVLARRLAELPADEGALEHLSLRWAAAAARSALAPGAVSAVEVVVGTSPGQTIPDRLAMAAVELLRTVDLSRLRTCPVAEGGCGWLFLDHSRNGSRRWCSMADCGTQAKIRKLTERRRRSATTIS